MLSTEIKLGVYYVQYGLKSKKKVCFVQETIHFFGTFLTHTTALCLQKKSIWQVFTIHFVKIEIY